MKTKYFYTKKIGLRLLFGILGLTAISCGSYQNVSYYDNDGIYGGEKKETTQRTSYYQENPNGAKYKEYFGSQVDKFVTTDSGEVFTDIETYSSIKSSDSTAVKTTANYSSWGTNDRDITINVYDNSWRYGWGWNNWNNWGWSYWGYRPYYCGYSYWNDWYYSPHWGYSYYGPSLSWGWSPYYYGGYYNGYVGYNHHNYAYVGGRRDGARAYSPGSLVNYGDYGVYNRSRRASGNTAVDGVGSYTSPRSTSNANSEYIPRNYIRVPRSFTPRNNESTPREYTPRNTNTPREYTPRNSDSPREYTPRNNNSTPRPYDSPRSYESPRSYDSPRSSSGGGRSGGRRG